MPGAAIPGKQGRAPIEESEMTVTSRMTRRSRGARLLAGLPLLAVLAACEDGLDYDLRGTFGGNSTAAAA